MMITVRSTEFPKTGFFDYTIFEKSYYMGEFKRFYTDFLKEYRNPSKKFYAMEFLTRYKDTPETDTGKTLVWEYQCTYDSLTDKFLLRSYMEVCFIEISFAEFCEFVESIINKEAKK